jgi:uncharacterized protein YyaL (SSP411 family)
MAGSTNHLGSGFTLLGGPSLGRPHFEKMLYDQALLVEAYLDAYL